MTHHFRYDQSPPDVPVNRRLITLALAQHDFLVGGINRNLRKALGLIKAAREAGADLLVFPELALTGYPPEDLLLRPGFLEACEDAVQKLAGQVTGIDVLFGHPRVERGRRYNSASWIREGRVIGRYDKQHLPNYAVFDEQRYFSQGSDALTVELKGVRIGVLICEDTWESGPALQSQGAGG